MSAAPPLESAEAPASVAAVSTLTALAVLSPWSFGSVGRTATGILTIVGLGVCAATCVWLTLRRRLLPSVPLFWPLAGLVALAGLQLVPLPPAMHHFVAPGSAAFWHPAEAPAAQVLGQGLRPISIHPEATRRSLGFLAAVVGLLLLSIPALSRRRAAVTVSVIVAVSGCGLALFGIVSHLLFAKLLYGRLAVPTVAPFGPFVSKNHFAGYVELVALLTLGLTLGLADQARRSSSILSWVDSPRAGRILVAFAASVVMMLATLVSQSRGGAVALASGLLYLAGQRLFRARRKNGRTRAIATLAGLALFTALVILVLPQRSRERLQSLRHAGEDSAGAFRLGTWRDGARAGAASPALGFGLGTFADALPFYKSGSGELRVEHAENEAVEHLVESGLVGLGFALAAGVLFARGLVKTAAPDACRLHAGLAEGAAAGVLALTVHGIVDFNLHVPSNALLFALLVALRVAFEMRLPDARWLQVPAGPLALGLALIVWSHVTLVDAPARPDLASLGGRTTGGMRGRFLQSALVRHLRQRPADAEAWVLLGWLHAETGNPAGRALARYGARLDPQRRELQAVAAQLEGEATKR